MARLAKIGLKTRLTVAFLLVAVVATVSVGWLSRVEGHRALEASVENKLTVLRLSRTSEIESYFENLRRVTASTAGSLTVLEATRAFLDARHGMTDEPLDPARTRELSKFYERDFAPRLARATGETVDARRLVPYDNWSRRLQDEYVVQNPYPPDERQKMVSGAVKGTYDEIHERFHPLFRQHADSFGFHDMYIVSLDERDVVYSLRKEPDFATNLGDGPYRYSNLARVVEAVREQPAPDATRLVDFRPYEPSEGAPAAFMASAVYDGALPIAILAVQLRVADLDRVMTAQGEWRDRGLGDTGESILVGPDRLARSTPRGFIESPDAFDDVLRDADVRASVIERIDTAGTPILALPIEMKSTELAGRNDSGLIVEQSYTGNEVLASYGPVSIPGLDWSIVAMMDTEEAFRQQRHFERRLSAVMVILVAFASFLAVWSAGLLMAPLRRTADAARRVLAGEEDVSFATEARDEVGQVQRAFSELATRVREQEKAIREQKLENERMIKNLLPLRAVERLRRGDKQIIDDLRQATVVAVRFEGFTELGETKTAEETAEVLDLLLLRLGEIAGRWDIEQIRTHAPSFLGVCGLSKMALDHTLKTVAFAEELMQAMPGFSEREHVELRARVGIHTGPVKAGLLAHHRYQFELWGDTVEGALVLRDAAPDGAVLMSDAVQKRVHGHFSVERSDSVPMGRTQLEAFRLEIHSAYRSARPLVPRPPEPPTGSRPEGGR